MRNQRLKKKQHPDKGGYVFLTNAQVQSTKNAETGWWDLKKLGQLAISRLWKGHPTISSPARILEVSGLVIVAPVVLVYAGATFWTGEKAPQKILSALTSKGSKKRISTTQSTQIEVKSSDHLDFPVLWNCGDDKDPILGATEPLIATFGTDLNVESYSVSFDELPEAKSKLSISSEFKQNQLRITPERGYWHIGAHSVRIKVQTDDASIEITKRFLVEWNLNFSESVSKDIIDLEDSSKTSASVHRNQNSGTIELLPEGINGAHPETFELSSFLQEIRPYSFGIRFRITKERKAAFQIALPGSITIQISDGQPNQITVKVGNAYATTHPEKLVRAKSKALHITIDNFDWSETEEWLWFSWDGHQLLISTGSTGYQIQKRITVHKQHLQSVRRCFLRSYGNSVAISQIRISSFLRSLNESTF